MPSKPKASGSPLPGADKSATSFLSGLGGAKGPFGKVAGDSTAKPFGSMTKSGFGVKDDTKENKPTGSVSAATSKKPLQVGASTSPEVKKSISQALSGPGRFGAVGPSAAPVPSSSAAPTDPGAGADDEGSDIDTAGQAISGQVTSSILLETDDGASGSEYDTDGYETRSEVAQSDQDAGESDFPDDLEDISLDDFDDFSVGGEETDDGENDENTPRSVHCFGHSILLIGDRQCLMWLVLAVSQVPKAPSSRAVAAFSRIALSAPRLQMVSILVLLALTSTV